MFWTTECRKMTENTEKTQDLIHEDYCQTIHELEDTVGISNRVCYEILTEFLNMHHSAAKFGPRLLTNDQSL
jgi:hypothetical protein